MSEPARAHADSLRGTLYGIALALALIGGAKASLELGLPALEVWRALSWVSAPVTQLEVRVFPFHGVVHVHVDYRYRVGDGERTGERYGFVDPTRYLSEDEVLALQQQRPTVCWVDPEDPSRAVLVRALPRSAYAWSGAALVALAAILASLVSAARSRPWAARIVMATPTIWSRAIMLLVAAWFGIVAIARASPELFVLAAALTGLGVLVVRREPVALAALAVLGAVVALGVIACAANPFAMMDVGITPANEPYFLFRYAADAAAIAMLGVATALLARVERQRARATLG